MIARSSEALFEQLREELTRDPKGPCIADVLARYAREEDDWREFVRFSDEIYTRNLVDQCELFELVVICWNRGQESPIHDHQGQRCWMTVLDGHVEEVHFRQPAGGGAALERGNTREFARGEVAYISDDIALHEIRPARGEPAVSLHLYAQPIRQCRIFDPATGAAELRQLTYHSVAAR